MKTLIIRSLVLVSLAGCNTVIKEQPVPPAGEVVSFTAAPAELGKPGDKATLTWATANATNLSLEQVGAGPLAIDAKAASGSIEVTLQKDALFVLTVRGQGGTDSASTSVRVKGSVQGLVFDAIPRTVPAGGYTTLVWSAPGATAVTLKELGGASVDLGGQRESGSVRVAPAKSTSYELDADGRKAVVAIEVGIAIYGFELVGAAPAPGQQVTLRWETSGGTSLTLKRDGVAAPLLTETDATKIVSGTFSEAVGAGVPVDGLLSYTLELTQGAVKVSQPLTVRVGGSVKVDELVLPTYAKASAFFIAQWKTTGADRLELWVDDVLVYLAPDAASAANGNRNVQAKASGVVKVKVIASNNRGAVAQLERTTTVVGPASVASFTAAPSTIASGGSPVTLSWSAPNARRLRIVGSDGHTVATARGPTAETGMATVFPNGAVTYTLDADNTIDPPVTATQAVTVTTPALFGPPIPEPVFTGSPVSLSWTVGAGALVYGAPHTAVATQAASTGFDDISATGAKLPFVVTADDAVSTFTPADFETFLYGNRVTGPVTVSTNGFFVFGASALSRATTVAIPNTTIERNFIAPLWMNLELASTGSIYWQVKGEAPERQLIVQFDKVKVKGNAASELTFQARVHQTGVLTYEYKTLTGALLPVPVIGVQGATAGLVATGAAAGSSLTLFGPVAAPVTLTVNAPQALGGFIKLAGGYLKARYTAPSFVAVGDVQISEVLYQPNAAIGTTGEWFEVSNRSTGPLDLKGWTIDFGGGSTHVIAGTAIVPLNGAVVLGQSASGAANDNVVTAYPYGTGFSMPQPVGTLTLSTGTYVVTSSWNSATANNGGLGVSIGVDTQPYLLSTDTSITVPHSIRCSSTAAFGTQAPQQLGSPGAAAGCFGYAMQSIPVSYFDISASGAVAALGDSVLGPVNLMTAPFTFGGVARTTMLASTNGFITFKTSTDSGTGNRLIPSTSATNAGTLAVFWDDLDSTAAAGSAVYSKRIAANEDPANPGAHWLVQWHRYEHFFAADNLNFQVKLFDTGVIEYHYDVMMSGSASNYANGNSATVWIENFAGNTALVSSVNKPVVLPSSAIRFTPN